MQLNFIALAVPLFIFFMLLEYRVSVKKKKAVYHFNEAVANLNVGIGERLSDMLTTGAFFYVFTWVHQHFALFTIPASLLTWFFLFLLTDLIWYWYHRFGHEVNLFWSVHVVHHQSEDFNFTVSARITVFQAVARGLFWSVLPLIGFDPGMITVLLLIHGAYPFFTHTQLIGKLGWLEYVLVTPSHHRVHHSSNPAYLDKNYGDVLIIWDKIFGTFKEEQEAPVYGLTSPLNSHSFLWQHFHFILEMTVAFRSAKGTFNKFRVLFGKPDDIDPRIRPYLERKLLSRNEQAEQTLWLKQFIFLQTLVTLLLLFLIILFEWYFSPVQLLMAALFIVLSVISTGAMLEQKRWVFYLDFARLCLTAIVLFSYFPSVYLLVTVLLTLGLILAFYKTIQHRYVSLLYTYT
jgi:sterol desaturase/sphingolipid hydroxylase (fatty acid hydroxylase superfamily)